jgi:hypothetical protein
MESMTSLLWFGWAAALRRPHHGAYCSGPDAFDGAALHSPHSFDALKNRCERGIDDTLAAQNLCRPDQTSRRCFATVNAIYARYFPEDPPARIFVCVPEWTGPFDIELDSVPVV